MYLIKVGSASQTATLFFGSASIRSDGLVICDENLTAIDLIGLLIATFGVYVATRPQAENKFPRYYLQKQSCTSEVAG